MKNKKGECEKKQRVNKECEKEEMEKNLGKCKIAFKKINRIEPGKDKVLEYRK